MKHHSSVTRSRKLRWEVFDRHGDGIVIAAWLWLLIALAAPMGARADHPSPSTPAHPSKPASPTTLPAVNAPPAPKSDSDSDANKKTTDQEDKPSDWSLAQPREKVKITDQVLASFTFLNQRPANVTAGTQGTLYLVQSNLQDPNTLDQIGTSQLCLTRDTSSSDASAQPSAANEARCDRIDLPFNEPTALALKKQGASPGAGTFIGQVSFRWSDRPEIKSFNLTVSSSPIESRIAGGALLLAGLILYFVVTVLTRGRITRDQALLPGYRLRGTVKKLDERRQAFSNETKARLPKLTKSVEALIAALSKDGLQPYIPGLIHLATTDPTVALDGLTKHLTQCGDRATVVTILLDALVRVRNMTKHSPKAFEKAVAQIDESSDSPSAAQAQETMNDIVQSLKHDNAIALHGGDPVVMQAIANFTATNYYTDTLPPTTETLLVELNRLTSRLWIWWGAISFVGGVTVLIVRNPGFGTPEDLISAALWGLGLSAVGTHLDQLNAASVGGVIGITIPKT